MSYVFKYPSPNYIRKTFFQIWNCIGIIKHQLTKCGRRSVQGVNAMAIFRERALLSFMWLDDRFEYKVLWVILSKCHSFLS